MEGRKKMPFEPFSGVLNLNSKISSYIRLFVKMQKAHFVINLSVFI